MIRLIAVILLTSLAACAAGECNDTNEDWPGIPKCAANNSPYSPYEAFIEHCEATGGRYVVGPNYEPICEAVK